MTKYNLDIDGKHGIVAKISSESYIRIKKKINKKVFNAIECYGDKDYYLAKKISENIFRYQDEVGCEFLGINLKYELSMTAHHIINDVIRKEYSHILKLESEIETLKRELSFYKSISKL